MIGPRTFEPPLRTRTTPRAPSDLLGALVIPGTCSVALVTTATVAYGLSGLLFALLGLGSLVGAFTLAIVALAARQERSTTKTINQTRHWIDNLDPIHATPEPFEPAPARPDDLTTVLGVVEGEAA